MRPVDNKNAAPHPIYDTTFDNSTGTLLLQIQELTYNVNTTGTNASYNFFRNGLDFNGAVPIAMGNIGVHQAGGTQTVTGVNVRPNMADVAVLTPNTVIYRQTYQAPARTILIPNRNNGGNVVINARIQAIEYHTLKDRNRRLRILLPMEEAAELARIWQEDQWNGTTVLANLMVDGAMLGGGNAATLRTWIWNELSRTNELASGYTGYKGAKNDLLKQLGKYCSYCESRYQDPQNLAIEHRIAKSSYPTEWLRWDNFILGCNVCNSNYKGEKPHRTFGINQAMQINYPAVPFVLLVPPGPAGPQPVAPFTDPPTNNVRLRYDEILNATQDYYLWPDVSEVVPGAGVNPASLSLRLCNYQLHEVDGGGDSVGVIAIADAVDLGNTRISVAGDFRRLSANVWNPAAGALQPRFVQVRVAVRNSNTGTAAFDNRKDTATGNTIPLVGLNQVNNAVGDQRMLERTEAWFRAIRALRILREQFNALASWQNSWLPVSILGWVLNPAPAIQLNDDQWESICENVEQTGFYSVWVTVFKQYDHNLAQELVTRLNNRSAADPNNLNCYHGTNITNSVLPYIPQL